MCAHSTQPDFGRPRTTFKRDYDCAFTKDEFMGRGSFSEVYKGYDAVSGARVAIKRTRRSTMRWVDRVGMAMEVDILNEVCYTCRTPTMHSQAAA